jgi:hypothetical protein
MNQRLNKPGAIVSATVWDVKSEVLSGFNSRSPRKTLMNVASLI